MLPASCLLPNSETVIVQVHHRLKEFAFHKTLGINHSHKQEPGLSGTIPFVVANLMFLDSNLLQAFWILINILLHMYENFSPFCFVLFSRTAFLVSAKHILCITLQSN